MRSPTPWMAALLVSVLVNGALIGFVIHRSADGPSWRAGHERGPDSGPPREGPASSRFDVRAFLAALPEAERELAEQRLHEHMETMRERGREIFETRRQADEILAADPFDPEAAQAALERVRDFRLGVETQMETALIEILAGLDAETRAAALEAGRHHAFERRRSPDYRRRDGGPHHGPGEGPPDGPREGPDRP